MKNAIKRHIKVAVAALYWRCNAHTEDNYAANYIIVAPVPRDTDDDLVVAEIDKQAAIRGGVATRIIREFRAGRVR